MKHTSLQHLHAALLLAAFLGSLPLHAADSVESNWNDICRVATNRPLTLTSADGSTVEGYCVAIQVDSISIQTSRGPVKVAKASLSRIEMAAHSHPKGHELRDLGHGVQKGLRQGVDWTFSTSAPLGIVTIPAVLGWAAVSAPFCALSDLHEKITHASKRKQQIKVI
jgi:hypothetical protein